MSVGGDFARAAAPRLDTASPEIRSITAANGQTYGEGGTIAFRVNFTESVIATGVPTLPITIGDSVRQAAWNGRGSGSRSLTFTLPVRAGDSAPAGVRVAGPIILSGGAAIRDRSGNELNPAASGEFPGARVDAVGPSVSDYGPIEVAGNRVSMRVTFTEPVTVLGKPSISFTLDGAPRQLVYARRSGSNVLIFTYRATRRETPTVENVVVPAPIIALSRGRIIDRAGNAATSISPPTEIGLSAASLPENEPTGTVAGVLSAVDADGARDRHTFTLVGGAGSTDNAAFEIIGNQLRTARPLDHESQTSYSVRVRSTDSGGLSLDKVFALTVTDVNEAPTGVVLTNTLPSLPENTSTASRIKVADIVIADEALGTNSITLTGTDSGSFEVDGLGLFLKSGVALDFETTQSHAVTVSVADASLEGVTPVTAGFTLTVTDVNDVAPVFTSGTTGSVAENAATSTAIYTAVTTDADGTLANRAVTYSIKSGVGDADFVQIDSTTGVVALLASANFVAKPSYAFTVVATNVGTGATLVREQAVAVTVTNVNEATTDITLSATSIAENSGVNAAVGTFPTTDPDATNTFTYTLVAGTGSTDNASFNISGSQLRATASLDFETKSSYSVRVRSTDQSSLSFEKTFTITVTDVNEAPTVVSLANTTPTISENTSTANRIKVADILVTDDALGTNTITLSGADSGSFDFDGLALFLKSAVTPNFETKQSYAVTLSVADASVAGSTPVSVTFTLTVTNANETPTDITLSASTIAENAGANAVVGTFTTTDPDAANTFTYTLVTGTGSTDNGSFNISGNQLRATASLDFEAQSSYSVRVRSTDQGGLSFEKTFSITVSDVNEAPTGVALTNTTSSLPENTSTASRIKMADIVITDDALGTNTVTLSGTDSGSFEVDGLGLFLKSGVAFDFETKQSCTVTVSVADASLAGSTPVTAGFTLTVTDVNDVALVFTSGPTGSLPENAAISTVIYTAVTTDADGTLANRAVTYSIKPGVGDASLVQIDATTGVVTLLASANFEAKSSYAFTVVATNAGTGATLVTEQAVTVAVTDANETPTDITLSATSIAENAGANAVVGTFTTTDPDAGNTFIYALVSGTGSTDNASFNISGNQLRATASLDFEAKSSYSIRVRAFDQGGLFTEKQFTITVTDIAVEMAFVTVGNASNVADTTGYGAVNYEYRLGTYEVTIGQYTAFLNAVAANDSYGLYNTNMASNLAIAGISRAGTPGSYTYSVIAPMGVKPAGADSPGDRPITYVSWFDAARFANWMHNGQGSGSTETGAYTISTGVITAASRTNNVNTYTLAAPSTLSVGDQVSVTGLLGTGFNRTGIVTSVSGSQFTMDYVEADATATGTGSMTGASATASVNALYRLPTENEWYKAAYYSPVKGGAGSPGYYVYATQSDSVPGNTIGNGVNQANYYAGDLTVTQASSSTSSQNYLTNVGTFTSSASYYGTYDQSGNVWEWSEVIVSGSSRGLRGCNWLNDAFFLSSSFRDSIGPMGDGNGTGFRLASPG